MTKIKLFIGLTAFWMAAGCAPTPTQIQDVLEKNPDILVQVIEKNPERVVEAIQKGSQKAQEKMQMQLQKEESDRMGEEFKNPLKPELPAGRSFMGSMKAPITIVEYTDFQCPYCGRGYATLEEVRKAYGDQVRVMVKNLPLPMHPMAMPAAKRFEALRRQDAKKAWAYYHYVFENQSKLENGEKALDEAVKKAGGDVARVKKEMESSKVTEQIKADMREAEKFGISGTPGFIINGVSVRGAYPFETFKQIIDRKLAETKTGTQN